MKKNRTVVYPLVIFLCAVTFVCCDEEPNDPSIITKSGNQAHIAGIYTFTKVDILNNCTMNISEGKLIINQLGERIWGIYYDEVMNGVQVTEANRTEYAWHGVANLDNFDFKSSNEIWDGHFFGSAADYYLEGKYYGTDYDQCTWEGNWKAVPFEEEE